MNKNYLFFASEKKSKFLFYYYLQLQVLKPAEKLQKVSKSPCNLLRMSLQ